MGLMTDYQATYARTSNKRAGILIICLNVYSGPGLPYDIKQKSSHQYIGTAGTVASVVVPKLA